MISSVYHTLQKNSRECFYFLKIFFKKLLIFFSKYVILFLVRENDAEFERVTHVRRCIEVVITRTTRNRLGGNTSRGFESHHLRHLGALAQLGAHHTGSVGVTGSNPVCSIQKSRKQVLFHFEITPVFLFLSGEDNTRALFFIELITSYPPDFLKSVYARNRNSIPIAVPTSQKATATDSAPHHEEEISLDIGSISMYRCIVNENRKSC